MGPLTWSFRARRGWNTLLNWVFPGESAWCILCRRPVPFDWDEADVPGGLTRGVGDSDSDGPNRGAGAHRVLLCPFCQQDVAKIRLAPRVRHLVHPPRGVWVVAAVRHDGLVRNLIRQWKYDGAIALTEWFADWAHAAWRKADATCYLWPKAAGPRGNPAWPGTDGAHSHAAPAGEPPGGRRGRESAAAITPQVLVPVPAAPDRLRMRGYDHIALLAAALGRRLGIPVCPALRRQAGEAGTGSQTARRRDERWRSVQGAFDVAAPEGVRGRRVLLVDDVVTTGATLMACAGVLADHAASVACLVVADVD
ncbi:ComF family protein [Alicyclobacillus sp.]|uniref:ComF family protein n=1 Tax=Alicyclobacillus sp. TaxID=61169 RepID=UPI0025C04AB0|nr:phosphoribosyltransferase family protein [Alicyclobacillus sp.]MCL6517453.1 hypothetical protein [Alicyclobacillus sp.]